MTGRELSACAIWNIINFDRCSNVLVKFLPKGPTEIFS